MISRKHPA